MKEVITRRRFLKNAASVGTRYRASGEIEPVDGWQGKAIRVMKSHLRQLHRWLFCVPMG